MMIARLLSVLDLFVPTTAKRTRADLGRARVFIFTHLFGPAIGTSITVFLYGVDREGQLQCAVIGICIWAFWLLPIMLKVTGNLTLCATISVQNLLFVTLFGAYFYGGTASPFLPWLLVALLLGFTFCSAAPTRIVAMFVANISIFIGLWVLFGTLPERVPLARLQTVGLLSVFGATLYVAWMAIYYGLLLSSESGLEREVKRHRETAARLGVVKDKAVQADRDKSAFLAKMSHELRTPLNAVIGYSEILLEDAEEADSKGERADDLRRINAAGKHLLSLVTDVLDLSKIESEQMEVHSRRFALRPLLNDVASTVDPMIRQNRNRLVIELAPQIDEIKSDETRLRQILINLLSNAAKFTEDGVITLSVRHPGGTRGKWVEFDVKDTGIGISQEDLAMLFQDFSQASGARSSRRDGTGLGLVLSKKLCTLMGGAITVDSLPGEGSRFSIRIPADLGSQTRPSDSLDDEALTMVPLDACA